jgi:hypothetical protein
VRAINHALTGAIIGLSVTNPIIAFLAAFVSHYVLDTIPHYGAREDNQSELKSKLFLYLLYIDAALCFILVLVIFSYRPNNYILAMICAFTATMPDFFSINMFLHSLKNIPWKPGLYNKFASKIQWFERPVGAYVELVWAMSAIFVLKYLI